jgi:hypothetical protein
MHILRHYPDTAEIDRVAQRTVEVGGLSHWLKPEPHPGS